MSESVGVQLGRVCPSCGKQDSAFRCRACGLEWGRDTDPTPDEQELADLLGVRYIDIVRGLGIGWRQEDPCEATGGVRWFVSGEPAQVAVGVHGPSFFLARPLTRWDDGGLDLQPADRREFTRDDLLHFPELVAEAADAIASRRRRSFRWCRCCRQVRPPEWFVGTSRVCERCESIAERIQELQAPG